MTGVAKNLKGRSGLSIGQSVSSTLWDTKFLVKYKPSEMDVAPWCYKWVEWVVRGIENENANIK